MSALHWHRMVLDFTRVVGPMLQEDQKPRARWRQLRDYVVLGTAAHLEKAMETRDILTNVVSQEGKSKRVLSMKIGAELTRNNLSEVDKLEAQIGKGSYSSAFERVLDLRLVPGIVLEIQNKTDEQTLN